MKFRVRTGPILSHDEARSTYDRLGRGLEAASFYEATEVAPPTA